MHCVSTYPCPPGKINFPRMDEIKKIANNNGFKATSKINKSKGLYENSHMFDFLLYK